MTRTPLFLLTLAVLTAALPRPVERQRAAPPAGTIAYFRGSKEIRLISSDGTNDRRLWPLPPPELVENAPKFWSVAYADTLMARYPDPD